MKKNILIVVLILIIISLSIFLVSKYTPKENIINNTNTQKELDLSNQNLIQVPNYVFEKTNLEILNLSNNKLTGAIPGEIRFLTKLKTLDLSNNLLTGVPAEVGQLDNLEILNLSDNQLTGLPNELGNLKNLKTLDLSGNDYSQQDLNTILERLPQEINVISN
jgi:Leucine-rich repeat (LRR) protein